MGSSSGKLQDEHISIVSRKEWGAREPFYTDPLRVPVSTVMFVPTHPMRFPWSDRQKAYSVLRDMQVFHMYPKFMPDVQFNFMVDENGTIYEGRGWFTKPSASLTNKPPNLNAIHIGYVGNLEEDGPSDLAMKAGNDLISFGMRHEYIRYHHHIEGLITGIVGTTLEECSSRNKKKEKCG